MVSTPSYREQHARVKRWYDRFAAIDQGRRHDQPSDYYLDDIYAFFLNCYHLKDWIRNDGTLDAAVRKGVEAFITSNRPLSMCAEICNSLKHLRSASRTRRRSTKKPRSGERPSFGRKVFEVAVGTR